MMEQELISKKDLLDVKGISYGQLYRWKRKQLIPEDWFIRKSTFTGQETFFPKEKIFARIDKIQEMKDDLSLDDLAEVFAPNATPTDFTAENLVDRGLISKQAFDFFIDQRNFVGTYQFEDILQVYLLDQLLTAGDINQEEAKMLLNLLKDKAEILQKQPCDIIFTRKFGVSSCMLVIGQNPIYFEAGTKIVKQVAFYTIAEQLKSQLARGEST